MNDSQGPYYTERNLKTSNMANVEEIVVISLISSHLSEISKASRS